jgi:hypothetical protein
MQNENTRKSLVILAHRRPLVSFNYSICFSLSKIRGESRSHWACQILCNPFSRAPHRLWRWDAEEGHGDLVKELTTYQQLTQIKAWLGGCSQLWHQVSLKSKITLRFLVIGCIKILAWH